MKRSISLILLAALPVLLGTTHVGSVDLKTGKAASRTSGGDLAVRVELVGERGAVYRPGKDISVSFSTTRDAYVVIYNVDSEGYVHLLYPADGRPARTEGRKTYFLPEPGSGSYWETGDRTGIEYIHALAVDDRSLLDEDELYFLSKSERLSEEKRLRIDLDPFLAFNMIDEEIVRNADRRPPATDYTYFYINRRVDYPRYLCAKCHSPGKIADPYAMECPEVVIERIAYSDEPRYPYPPLYDIRYADDIRADDDYTSTGYGERWLEDESEGNVDTHVYLTLSMGTAHYPWYSPWPYYGGWYAGWGLYPAWDPFWGGFYWNIWWNDYFWWPYYRSWYYPYSICHGCYYPCWHCGDYWHRRHPIRYRPAYADRNVVKRHIDYGTTYKQITRERSLANSRLIKEKQRTVAERLERSDLRRRAVDRRIESPVPVRSDRGVVPGREVDRRSDRDRVLRGREAVRGAERSAQPGSVDRSRKTIERRSTRTSRDVQRREEQKSREADRDRSTVKPAPPPERRSRDADRGTAPRSGSSDRSGEDKKKSRGSDSSASKRRVSNDGAAHGPARSVGASRSSRGSAAPARSTSGSSSSSRRASSGGNTGKSRNR